MTSMSRPLFCFFNDTATTEIYTLSLHDALPIYPKPRGWRGTHTLLWEHEVITDEDPAPALRWPNRFSRHLGDKVFGDRKSTRLNSSHANISYAVFCLKKKKRPHIIHTQAPTTTY